MTTEQKHYCQAFEYAKNKVESGEWSCEQAFEYAARCEAESGDWNWEQVFEWCKQACEAFFKKEQRST